MDNISIKIKTNKSDCCGCGACVQICPKSSLELKPDENGFLYPYIVSDSCIQCDLCDQVCSYKNDLLKHPLLDKEHIAVYAAVSKTADLKQSASGGLFATIAKSFIQNNGIVYGAAMSTDKFGLYTKHIRVEHPEELYRTLGSKYVQSELGDSFSEIRDDLNKGKKVLFSGTPCQVAGLKGFLRKPYSNLYTIDIVCHGVPSNQFFQDYLRYEESKRRIKIKDFRFRDKSKGWQLLGSMEFEDKNGNLKKKVFSPIMSSYYQMFLNSYIYRINCYECPYAGGKRPGDITIGDYWCIELIHPELCNDNDGEIDYRSGTSCMIVNNNHGEKLIEDFGSEISTWSSSYENAARYNGQLQHSSVLRKERKLIFQLYQKGYASIDKWYWKRTRPIIVKRKIRSMIPKFVKNSIKNMIKTK